ncbi:hypothetical protein Tco_0591017 [Tanacetum coccineum]
MSEEDHLADVAVMPKFDMPCYESTMSSKDVKSLALRHRIPLDLHPCALSEGWTMDQLPEDMIGLYEQFFEFSGIRVPFSTFLLGVIKHFRVHISQLVPLDRRAILDAMAWRHHDSDVNDTVPDDGFDILDVQALTERFIDLRPVPSGLLFKGGLATTWDFAVTAIMEMVEMEMVEMEMVEMEIQMRIIGNNDLAAYTQRFQELTMMCTKMVPVEEDRVEKFIGGLPDNIQGNVISTKPTRLQDA